VPGTYTVRMHVNGATESQTFTLMKDPRSKATQADLEDQFAFLMQVRDETSKANDAVKVIRNFRSQIADREKKLPADKRAAFESSANAMMTQLSAAEQEIYQVKNRSGQDPLNYPIKLNNKIAALAGVASGNDARPTNQTREVFRILSGQLDTQLSRLHSAISTSLPGLNAQLKGAGVAELVETSVEVPSSAATVTRGAEDDADDMDQDKDKL
jgi:hypothetical protein